MGTVQGGRKCGTSVDHHTEKGDWAYWNYVPELIRRIQKKKIYLDLYLNCRGDRDFEQAIQDLSQYLFYFVPQESHSQAGSVMHI